LPDAKQAADKSARFWWNYYKLLFPLRSGKAQDARTLLGGLALFEGPEPFNLEQRTNDGLSRFFLDGMRLPPLLPSIHKCEELIADHHLTCTAVTNVLLRTQGVTGEQFLHEFRLGVLLHELSDEEPLKTWMKQFSRAW
jgi:hypothetical protein